MLDLVIAWLRSKAVISAPPSCFGQFPGIADMPSANAVSSGILPNVEHAQTTS